MIKTYLFLLQLTLSMFIACEMDSFLFNEKRIEQYKLPGNTIPDSLLEPITLKSENFKIYGYFINSNGIRPGITILYCHGNRDNLDYYWNRVMLLQQLGINIFIYDYRGFGKSEGKPSEKGMYKDAEAALDYVLSRNDTKIDSLCIYGYSLGNIASIYLASEEIKPLCLIAESPFASANSLTQGSTVLDIPTRWITEGEFDNVSKVKKINTPFLLFHGTNDDFVRYRDNGKIIFENAPQPKKLILVQGANHDILKTIGKEEYLTIVKEWINFSIHKQR